MGESESHGRLINPCFFHLQKLELELKCPACLNLLSHPLLLPCDHIFCRSCITSSKESDLTCPVCKLPFLTQDLRFTSHLETIVNIYRSMSATFSGTFCQPGSQVELCENKKSAVEHQNLCSRTAKGKPKEGDVQINSQQRASITGVEAFPEQVGPSSPLSLGGLKYSDDDSNDHGSVLSGKSLLTGGSCKKESKVDLGKGVILSSTSNMVASVGKIFSPAQSAEEDADMKPSFQMKDGHGRDAKRQKLSTDVKNSELNDSHSLYTCLDTPSSHSHSEHEGATDPALSPMSSEDASDTGFLCAFCHSSKESKSSGSMMHYINGEPVDAEHAKRPEALHVHIRCIEWAPQVYFVEDNVKNLEAEISRAGKIKCSRCRKKGAALGCYAKSCRKSFHVPCAVQIPDCRWDCDNFLVLCPTHSSRKLPGDRSSTTKNVKNLLPPSFEVGSYKYPDDHTTVKQNTCELWVAPPNSTKGWILCGSALSIAEKDLLAKFARLSGTMLTKEWSPDVTHVIASTDQYGACSRTLKFLMAILSGKWILRIEWVKACLEAKRPVFEEKYEISHDIHGCFDGPRNGRIRVMEQKTKLFNGLNFYFSGDFVPTYKGYLEELILAAGGNIIQAHADGSHSRVFVLYSLDPPLESNSEDKDAIDKRFQEAKAAATRIGAEVIGHTWVLDSLAACKVQPLAS